MKQEHNKSLQLGMVLAVDYAESKGADTVEAYPLNTENRAASNQGSRPGAVSMFEKADFRKVGQRSISRPIFRYILSD